MATLALAVLAGCATVPGSAPLPESATPEARQAHVAARAQARWDAIIKGDMELAYTYLSPGTKQVTSLEKFKASGRRGSYREARVDSVSCDVDACKVRVLLTYDHRLMKGITTPLTEAWIFEGSQAWIVN